MKFQRDPYSCGVFAIMNALRAQGHKIPEKRIRAHTATTKEHGTQEHGIKNALERLGFTGEDIKTSSKDEAWEALLEALEDGSSVILSVDVDQHWVAVVGRCGEHVIVFDSQRTKKNKEENGSPVYTKKHLLHRWESKKGEFFGIIVRKVSK